MSMKEKSLFSIMPDITPKINEGGAAFSLRSRDYKDAQIIVLENHPADSRVKVCEDNVFQTLSSRMGTGGGNVPMVMEGINGDISGTLDSNYHKGCGEREGTEREVVCVGNGQMCNMSMKPIANALDCMHDQQAVMETGMPMVRRLTPTECALLQGYPADWMNIGEWTDSKGKKHKDADAPKYKAAGNSIALPFWQWLAERICAEYDRPVTMASLFDGIGGFPLVFSRCGAEPVWASEIEEFPIAVTKIRFPESEDK